MIKTKILVLIITALMYSGVGYAESPLKGKKILFVFGGWERHEPEECMDLLYPWLVSEGATVDTFRTLDKYSDEEYMQQIDLVIQTYTMSKISNEQEKGLLRAVKNGTGIAGWHGGLADAFRDNPTYQFMVGGQWVAHPGGVIDYTVNVLDTDDPVVKGLSDFDVHTEQYYMHVDPNVKVLATTTFTGDHTEWIDGATMPVVWKKYYGKGRVFYSSLGHVATDLQVPEIWAILTRGIRWSVESKYAPKEDWLSPVYKQ